MTAPTFFTVAADFKSVVADAASDVDYDPQLGPVSATVTFRPMIRTGGLILAVGASPRPTAFVPAPIRARIDSEDGRLKMRVAPDGDRDDFASSAGFPRVGNVNKVYFSIAAQSFYKWTGTAYVETFSYAPVRLLADTPLLDLDSPLLYNVTFSDVVYNGVPGMINSFTFQAPNFDTEVNLIRLMRGQGIAAPMLVAVTLDANGDLIFLNINQTTFGPLALPEGVMVLVDNRDSTWTLSGAGGGGS